MAITIKPSYRGPAVGIAAAALLIGSFLLGTANSGSAADRTGSAGGAGAAALLTSSATGGRITVSGTGTWTGTPNQLILTMGVQVNASSVSIALREANQAASRVMSSLQNGGVSKADIQTSGLSIQPNYRGSAQVPIGYGVSEQLTATLTSFAKAGSQIQAAVTAGGNATVVDGVSLNLTDTSALLAKARAAAVRDAQAKAEQFAHAIGQPLGAVISISDQSSAGPYPLFAQAASRAPAASVPISPGSQQVSVQINVVYSIG
ncbi:MAG TPA: SIMPL domain-containing protein [Streptosporangiaceae bacterium]|nr:SIMPL domain-containing protein [Streptosporangiaceae bacterium]